MDEWSTGATAAPDMNELLRDADRRGASDVHITVGIPPMFRIDGRLVRTGYAPLVPEATRALVYAVMTEGQRRTLEQNLECDFAYSVPGAGRYRVNAYFQRGSVGAAFRLIPGSIRSIRDLGLPAELEELALRPRGLVLVTGPTGSGKSTTLAAMIDHINHRREQHVITVEDPIEYLHEHKCSVIEQREVGFDTKSFAEALRHVLRQDPDIILIGEMRDLETVSAALTAAETGHLVLATLHTQNASQTIDRIIDVYPAHQQQQIRVQLAGSLQGVVSQQLIPTSEGTGRAVACELLVATPGIRNLIREGKTHQLNTAIQTGTQHGMVTMDHALADMYKRGIIALEVALQHAVDTDDLNTLIGK